MVSTESSFSCSGSCKIFSGAICIDIFSTRSLRGSSERHEHRRNASPMLQRHSTYRNIGIPWLFMSFMGPPIPCTLPTVRRCEFEAPARAEFWLRSSIRIPSASKMAESSCTAFDRQRRASKSQPWESSGRVSIRRKEIFVFLDTNSATTIWDGILLRFCSGLGTPSPPLTGKLMCCGVCGGSFEPRKTASVGSLDLSLEASIQNWHFLPHDDHDQ